MRTELLYARLLDILDRVSYVRGDMRPQAMRTLVELNDEWRHRHENSERRRIFVKNQ